MNIAEEFNNISVKYDAQRKQILPCFDDFYHLPITAINFQGNHPKILDIGGGTGLFSMFLLEKYPQADITLIDLSEKMLDMAKKRFAAKINHFHFILDDYTNYKFNEKYDIIISALSIHHICAEKKQTLYKKIFKLLNADGVFINADQVLSPTPEIERLYQKLWMESVANSGLSENDITLAYKRTAYDDPSPLIDQLHWLKNAGFKHFDCIYKYYHFCVFYAQK